MPTLQELAHVTLSPEKRAEVEAQHVAERTAQEARETEIARQLGEIPAGKQRGGRLPAPHPGYAVLLDSVKLALRVAHQHGTAMNNVELWFRADFSALAASDKMPAFDAFSGWLRHKVEDGVLIYRAETREERKVRIGGEKARFNRFANLYSLASLTDVVPEVTKKYDDYEPLTDEQQAWATQHPAERRQRPKKTEPEEQGRGVEALIEAGIEGAASAGRVAAKEIKDRQDAAAAAGTTVETRQDGRVAEGKRRRGRPRKGEGVTGEVAQFDSAALDRMQNELTELRGENRQMRTAFYHMGMALASLTAVPENGEN